MAIFFEYVMTVNGATAKLDKDIYLYKGNRNIDYYFTIKDAAFRFSTTQSGNIVEKLSPSHAMVSVLKPDGSVVTSGMAAIKDDKVKLTITADFIDEDTEIGTHCIVIDLLDEENDSLVTLPPILNQMHILERITPVPEIVSGNQVNISMVNYAQTTAEEEEVVVFDDEGNYVKTEWVTGNKITTTRLNKIEEGVYQNNQQLKTIANKTVVENGKLFLLDKDGNKVDEGTELPSASGVTDEQVQIAINNAIAEGLITVSAGNDMPNVVLMGDSISDTVQSNRGEWVRLLPNYLTFKSFTNYAVGAAKWTFSK